MRAGTPQARYTDQTSRGTPGVPSNSQRGRTEKGTRIEKGGKAGPQEPEQTEKNGESFAPRTALTKDINFSATEDVSTQKVRQERHREWRVEGRRARPLYSTSRSGRDLSSSMTQARNMASVPLQIFGFWDIIRLVVLKEDNEIKQDKRGRGTPILSGSMEAGEELPPCLDQCSSSGNSSQLQVPGSSHLAGLVMVSPDQLPGGEGSPASRTTSDAQKPSDCPPRCCGTSPPAPLNAPSWGTSQPGLGTAPSRTDGFSRGCGVQQSRPSTTGGKRREDEEELLPTGHMDSAARRSTQGPRLKNASLGLNKPGANLTRNAHTHTLSPSSTSTGSIMDRPDRIDGIDEPDGRRGERVGGVPGPVRRKPWSTIHQGGPFTSQGADLSSPPEVFFHSEAPLKNYQGVASEVTGLASVCAANRHHRVRARVREAWLKRREPEYRWGPPKYSQIWFVEKQARRTNYPPSTTWEEYDACASTATSYHTAFQADFTHTNLMVSLKAAHVPRGRAGLSPQIHSPLAKMFLMLFFGSGRNQYALAASLAASTC
ncbi:hypothetical protein P4O66_001542 [Electrophorus voltai]|uniref:Uncharacterized protein n=1 Tax=Electrophorus voltai TaxID=2609070 RepID=A0AAD9DTX1_9TELE|nr:hypothetical protein P4O66_001542 [Electrophorus voltai]